MDISEKQFRARLLSGIISTDDIIPAHYKHKFTDPSKLALHVFENKFPGFCQTLKSGDLIVSDSIFGIGSSREQAVSALLASGVMAVIAPSFGRIFFRNAWNLGLIALEISLPMLTELSLINIDLNGGKITTAQGIFSFLPIPKELIQVFEYGGILNYVKQKYLSVECLD